MTKADKATISKDSLMAERSGMDRRPAWRYGWMRERRKRRLLLSRCKRMKRQAPALSQPSLISNRGMKSESIPHTSLKGRKGRKPSFRSGTRALPSIEVPLFDHVLALNASQKGLILMSINASHACIRYGAACLTNLISSRLSLHGQQSNQSGNKVTHSSCRLAFKETASSNCRRALASSR